MIREMVKDSIKAVAFMSSVGPEIVIALSVSLAHSQDRELQ